MGDVGEKVMAGIAAIIGLAVIAIVVSQNANTVNVLGSFFSGVTNLIAVAISPITGQSVTGANATGLTGGAWQSGFALNANPSTALGFGIGNGVVSGAASLISGLTGSGSSGSFGGGAGSALSDPFSTVGY
jgi:hypothetical protein